MAKIKKTPSKLAVPSTTKELTDPSLYTTMFSSDIVAMNEVRSFIDRYKNDKDTTALVEGILGVVDDRMCQENIHASTWIVPCILETGVAICRRLTPVMVDLMMVVGENEDEVTKMLSLGLEVVDRCDVCAHMMASYIRRFLMGLVEVDVLTEHVTRMLSLEVDEEKMGKLIFADVGRQGSAYKHGHKFDAFISALVGLALQETDVFIALTAHDDVSPYIKGSRMMMCWLMTDSLELMERMIDLEDLKPDDMRRMAMLKKFNAMQFVAEGRAVCMVGRKATEVNAFLNDMGGLIKSGSMSIACFSKCMRDMRQPTLKIWEEVSAYMLSKFRDQKEILDAFLLYTGEFMFKDNVKLLIDNRVGLTGGICQYGGLVADDGILDLITRFYDSRPEELWQRRAADIAAPKRKRAKLSGLVVE
jgi:hypothetical protein